MTRPTEADLASALTEAARAAVSQLFRERPDEQFYYVSLITSPEGHTPVISAWSEEALAHALEGGKGVAQNELKWSYADSPYFAYGERHFEPVRELLSRMGSGADDRATEVADVELRLRAMEHAMAQLDESGIFGRGEARKKIVINAEVMPPDSTNVARAKRLNPPEALVAWLAEAAEQ
jgi:hypothetical protein